MNMLVILVVAALIPLTLAQRFVVDQPRPDTVICTADGIWDPAMTELLMNRLMQVPGTGLKPRPIESLFYSDYLTSTDLRSVDATEVARNLGCDFMYWGYVSSDSSGTISGGVTRVFPNPARLDMYSARADNFGGVSDAINFIANHYPLTEASEYDRSQIWHKYVLSLHSERSNSLYLHSRNAYFQGAEAGYVTAIESCTVAIALDSSFALAFSALADAYTTQYRCGWVSERSVLDSALFAAERGVLLRPDLPETHRVLGETYFQLAMESIGLDNDQRSGEYFQKAARCYDYAGQVAPGYQLGFSQAISLYAAAGDYQDALRAFRKSIRIDPGHAATYSNMAVLQIRLAKAGDWDFSRASALLEKALRLDPSDAVALYNLACIAAQEGRASEAVHLLERVMCRPVREWRFNYRVMIPRDPDFDPIRETFEFRELCEDYQIDLTWPPETRPVSASDSCFMGLALILG